MVAANRTAQDSPHDNLKPVSKPRLEPAVQAILERAQIAEAALMRAIRAGIDRDARLSRATNAWLRVSTFRGERIPRGLTGQSLHHYHARLIVELGQVLARDGWKDRVNSVVAGLPAKTVALEILRKAMDAALMRSFLVLERLGYSPDNPPPESPVN